jgi:hypothetical protein
VPSEGRPAGGRAVGAGARRATSFAEATEVSRSLGEGWANRGGRPAGRTERGAVRAAGGAFLWYFLCAAKKVRSDTEVDCTGRCRPSTIHGMAHGSWSPAARYTPVVAPHALLHTSLWIRPASDLDVLPWNDTICAGPCDGVHRRSPQGRIGEGVSGDKDNLSGQPAVERGARYTPAKKLRKDRISAPSAAS